MSQSSGCGQGTDCDPEPGLKGNTWTLQSVSTGEVLIKSSYILSKNKEVRFYYKLKQTIADHTVPVAAVSVAGCCLFVCCFLCGEGRVQRWTETDRNRTGRHTDDTSAGGLVVFVVIIILAFVVRVSLPLLSLNTRLVLCTVREKTDLSEESDGILTYLSAY